MSQIKKTRSLLSIHQSRQKWLNQIQNYGQRSRRQTWLTRKQLRSKMCSTRQQVSARSLSCSTLHLFWFLTSRRPYHLGMIMRSCPLKIRQRWMRFWLSSSSLPSPSTQMSLFRTASMQRLPNSPRVVSRYKLTSANRCLSRKAGTANTRLKSCF